MSGMDEMLVCALQRKGHPMTAGEVLDEATGLAMSSGWPKRAWAGLSAQKAFQKLKKLQDDGMVERRGTKREDGSDRPLWVPVAAYDTKAPLPEWSDEAKAKEPHKLAKLNREQVFVVFDQTEEVFDVFVRHRREQEELSRKQMEELRTVVSRAKRELVAHGIKEEEF